MDNVNTDAQDTEPVKRVPPVTEDRRPQSVFVLAGQSNMAGRGGVHKGPDGGKVWDGKQPDLKSPGTIPRVFPDLHTSINVPTVKCTWSFHKTYIVWPAGDKVQCWDASGQWRPAEEPLHAGIDVG